MARQLVVALATLTLPNAFVGPALSGQDFAVETVDRGANLGNYVSLVIDPNGEIWIAYGAATARFASGGAGNWTLETPGRLQCAPRSAVALDRDGNPGIVCFTTYVHKLADAWVREGFGYDRHGFHAGWDSGDALATRPDGSVIAAAIHTYVIHHGYPGEGIYHTLIVADRNANGWTWRDLEGPAFVPEAPNKIAIAIDAHGDPHLGVVPAANQTFRYYRRLGRIWSLEYVSAITADFSIATDSNDNPAVVYADDRGLLWAEKQRTWVRHRFIEGASLSAPDLSFDENDVPHVKYHTESDVRYATIGADGMWRTWIVDVARATSSGLALDSSGVPHIAFYDVDSQELRYAVRREATRVRPKTWSSAKTIFRR